MMKITLRWETKQLQRMWAMNGNSSVDNRINEHTNRPTSQPVHRQWSWSQALDRTENRWPNLQRAPGSYLTPGRPGYIGYKFKNKHKRNTVTYLELSIQPHGTTAELLMNEIIQRGRRRAALNDVRAKLQTIKNEWTNNAIILCFLSEFKVEWDWKI